MVDNDFQIQNLLEHMDTAVVWVDDQLTFLYSNPSGEVLLEKSVKKLSGMNLHDLVKSSDEVFSLVNEVKQSGRKLTRGEFTLNLHHHRPVLVHLTITPHSHQGLILELRPFERQHLINRESAKQNEYQATRNLMRGLAHEIKNPLGGIRGAAQLLQADLGDDTGVQEYTDIMIKETDRLKTLIDRMSGPITRPCITALNIHTVANRVNKLLEAEASEHVEILCDYDPSLPEIKGDEDHLIQATLNLARNALEALPETGGSITFQTRIRRQVTLGGKFHALGVSLAVIDDGPGVPKELKAQIFFPMVTGKPTGTGLGLPTAQSLINAQGGSIQFKSSPGETIFEILLPTAETKT